MWPALTTSPGWAKEYKLYLGRYRLTVPTDFPSPWTSSDMIFWQFSDREPVGNYRLDCNYFFGTEKEFYALANVEFKSLAERVSELETRVANLESIVLGS